MTFTYRRSSANNIFNQILKVSDLYQLNLAKFMCTYNDNILPSSFDTFFSKLCKMYDYDTATSAENFHHKRVRTYYDKNMLQYVAPVAWDCISNKMKILPLHMFSYQVKSKLFAGIGSYVRYILICKMFLNRLPLSTFLVLFFVLNSCFVPHPFCTNTFSLGWSSQGSTWNKPDNKGKSNQMVSSRHIFSVPWHHKYTTYLLRCVWMCIRMCA